MAVNISCPACGVRGDLPDVTPPNAVLTCQRCGVRFTPPPAAPPPPPPLPSADGPSLGIWVGDGAAPTPPAVAPAPPAVTRQNAAAHLDWVRAETVRFAEYVTRQLGVIGKMREQVLAFDTKTRAEALQREQAVARDRALLDARAADLDAQATSGSASLQLQAEELQAELDRQVAAERENLARRVEAVAGEERAQERRRRELDEAEKDVRERAVELDRLRGENADLRAEVTELRERATGQAETIERMVIAGQRLIRQRDELRAKVQSGAGVATP